MIIWNTNKRINEDIKSNLIRIVKDSYNKKGEFYTSFYNDKATDKLNNLLNIFYDPLIKRMMMDLGMWKRSTYNYSCWTQMYNSETTTHNQHEHFSGNEIISFSHIIDASKEKCFYFLNDYGDKTYPSNQQSGDFFAWPSWLIHGVDKVKEPNTNRLIVAGNIMLKTFQSPNENQGNLVCDTKCDSERRSIIWSIEQNKKSYKPFDYIKYGLS
tara:strand:- start:734 stop:1372 length:639 start_codon:yes stop_codon:yes gene_type:complete